MILVFVPVLLFSTCSFTTYNGGVIACHKNNTVITFENHFASSYNVIMIIIANKLVELRVLFFNDFTLHQYENHSVPFPI